MSIQYLQPNSVPHYKKSLTSANPPSLQQAPSNLNHPKNSFNNMLMSFNKHNAMIMAQLIFFMLSVCALPASSDDSGFQAILINFKNSLTDTDGLQNWTQSVDQLCINGSSNWTGVICKDGRMIGLRLENLRLGGQPDVELLSQLPLLSLSLSNNNLSGAFPS